MADRLRTTASTPRASAARLRTIISEAQAELARIERGSGEVIRVEPEVIKRGDEEKAEITTSSRRKKRNPVRSASAGLGAAIGTQAFPNLPFLPGAAGSVIGEAVQRLVETYLRSKAK